MWRLFFYLHDIGDYDDSQYRPIYISAAWFLGLISLAVLTTLQYEPPNRILLSPRKPIWNFSADCLPACEFDGLQRAMELELAKEKYEEASSQCTGILCRNLSDIGCCWLYHPKFFSHSPRDSSSVE